MSTTAEKTVRDLALENPAATRVFEKLGIDYCCGGNKSLEEACRTVNLPMDEVLDSLEMAESLHAPSKRTVIGQRSCWLIWLRTSTVLITSTPERRWLASDHCSTRSAPSTGTIILNCCGSGPVFKD